MAVTADSVVVELLSRTGQHDDSVIKSASIFETASRRTIKAANDVERSAARTGAATRNLAFQFSDIGAQLASRTSPFVILAQQGPQVVQALQDVASSGARLGTVLRSLALPGALALLGALTPLITSLLNAEEATDLARNGASGLADAQSVLGEVFDLTTGKIKSQNELLIANARLTAIRLREEARTARESAGRTVGNTQSLGYGAILGGLLTGGLSEVQGRNSRSYAAFSRLNDIRLASSEQDRQAATRRALSFSETANFDGLSVTAQQFRQAVIDTLQAAAKDAAAALIDKSLDGGKLAPALRNSRKGSSATVSPEDAFARQLGFKDYAAYDAAVIQPLRDQDEQAKPFQRLAEASARFEASLRSSKAATSDLVKEVSLAGGPMSEFFDQLEQEAKQADQAIEDIAVRGLESLTDGITDAITGATSLGDAFRRLADQIIADLIRIAVRQAIVKPLAEALSSGGSGDVFRSIGKAIFGKASGGYVGPNSLHRVNETAGGVELLRMGPTGGEVIPLGRAQASSRDGGVTVMQTISVDARGAVMNDQFARMILNQADQNARQFTAVGSKAAYEAAPQRLQRQNLLGS